MIRTCLDLSTAHIRQATMDMLSNMSKEQRLAAGWPAMTIAPYLDGAFVTVPHDPSLEQMDAMPSDLQGVLNHARGYGLTLVRFDKDGDDDPNLDVFAW